MLGLAPMLWASGTGAEIIQPMAAPVLGGILVSDEIIDLLLPVLFYRQHRRRWQKLHAGGESRVAGQHVAEAAEESQKGPAGSVAPRDSV